MPRVGYLPLSRRRVVIVVAVACVASAGYGYALGFTPTAICAAYSPVAAAILYRVYGSRLAFVLREPYIIGGRFWRQATTRRVVYVGGGIGTGKTLLAVAIARQLWRRGYRVYANIPLTFRSIPGRGCWIRHAVILLDEAGVRYVDARNYRSADPVTVAAAYVRHRDQYILAPTERPPDKRLRGLTVEAVGGGKLLRAYRWYIEGTEQAGAVFLVNSGGAFRHYDTLGEVDDDKLVRLFARDSGHKPVC